MSESSAMPAVRQRGLWFEELRTGVVYKHAPGRTISEADNTLFSAMTMNPQSLHLDAAFSEGTEFGERLVNSLLTMSVLVGLSVGQLTQGTIAANLGFRDARFPAPVRHGDTIYGETTVLEKRLSASRPGQGVVTFEHVARNQRGEVIAVVTRTTLMLCRPEDEAVTAGFSPSLPGPALLFCPADRPDRCAKALAAADAVVLDLEDGVGAGRKDAAREGLIALLAAMPARTPADSARVIVRVNALGTPEHEADIEALRATPYRMIMLPKAERRDQVDALAGWRVVALCETPLGVLAAADLAAAPNVVALMWGAEDLIAAMKGRTSRHADGRYLAVALHARSSVLLAATAHGRLAIDAVYTNIADLDGLAAEAQDAASSGFALKACLHPSQVPVVRAAFRAGEAQVEWARRVLAAASDGGAIAVDGQMIDAPLVRQAEAILASVD